MIALIVGVGATHFTIFHVHKFLGVAISMWSLLFALFRDVGPNPLPFFTWGAGLRDDHPFFGLLVPLIPEYYLGLDVHAQYPRLAASPCWDRMTLRRGTDVD